MRFAGDNSHVKRLTKAEARERGIAPSSEKYVVTKDYTDPFEGKSYRKGQVISNRQGRNVQVQEQGSYKSYSQYTRIWSPTAKRSSDEVKNRDSWIRRSARATKRSPNAIRTDPKFRQAWTQFNVIGKGDRKNKSPTGPLAKLLVAAGLRDPGATYNVGDTPDTRKGNKRGRK